MQIVTLLKYGSADETADEQSQRQRQTHGCLQQYVYHITSRDVGCLSSDLPGQTVLTNVPVQSPAKLINYTVALSIASVALS